MKRRAPKSPRPRAARRPGISPRVNGQANGSARQIRSYVTFFEGGNRYNSQGDLVTQNWLDAARDTQALLPRCDWKQLLNSGRFLFANVPILRGALLEQASYSFPLEPHYTGEDDAWGRLAKEWLYYWKQQAEYRGGPFDCHVSARVRLLARKTDGDIGRLLTFDDATGYPRLQFIRAHRIGVREDRSRTKTDGTVQGGPYNGAKIDNGIITDRRGRPIAYRLLADEPKDDQDIPAASFLLCYNPDYSDQSRGISELMASIGSFGEIKRLREYEMRAQQIQAREALLEQNEEGEASGANFIPSTVDETTNATSVAGVTIEQFDKGLTRYYRSNTGSGLELIRPDRPGPGCQEFEDRIVRGAFYGIEWDPDFALAIKEPGGAWARTILQKVNRAISNNQRIEARCQLAEDTYALAKAIDLKLLAAPPDGDIFSWDYSGPARLTADSGNDENAKREKYKLGILTLRQWASEDGCWWEEIRKQKQIETRDLLTRAQELQTEFPELTLMDCVQLLEQRTPNGQPASATASETASEPEPQPISK